MRRVRRIAVRVACLAAVAALAAPAGPSAGPPAGSPPRSNILLITVDSLRRDHVGCYAGGSATPVIDALAARGVRFERAYAASPSTAPSIATILTGRIPSHHGLRHDRDAWVEMGTPTIATILKRAGYRTGAIPGSFHLDADRGLSAGFDLYDGDIEGVRKNFVGRSRERRADEVADRGIKFLATAATGPFFLWLDFYDPHYDYDPPEPFKTRHAADPYAGEVAYVDAQIGRVIGTLRDRGLMPATLIVLASSHGEGLGDRGETGHGSCLFENTIRVPLLVVPGDPADAGKGRTIGAVVGLVDLAPTILDLLGVAPPPALDGESLRPLLEGAAPDRARPAFVEAVEPYEAYGWSTLFAVIDADRKVVVGQRLEAFDLAADPGEAAPLQPAPPWAAELERLGRARLGSLAIPAQLRTRIRAQIDRLALPWRDSPVCIERETWPDPRDRMNLLDALTRARTAADQGFPGTASSLATEKILPVDAANVTGLELAGFLTLRDGADEGLYEMLSILQCNYPYRATAYHFLGHQLQRRKADARAEVAYQIFAAIEPRSEEPFYDLAAFYASQGRKDAAFENLKKSIDRGARDLDYIQKDLRMAPLKNDPRFSGLVGPIPPKAPQKKK